MTDSAEKPQSLPDQPNLRHLKDQAKNLLKTGGVKSLAEAQFQIARLYGFASWPKLKAHVDLLEETGQLKQAIDTNNLDTVKTQPVPPLAVLAMIQVSYTAYNSYYTLYRWSKSPNSAASGLQR